MSYQFESSNQRRRRAGLARTLVGFIITQFGQNPGPLAVAMLLIFYVAVEGW